MEVLQLLEDVFGFIKALVKSLYDFFSQFIKEDEAEDGAEA